MLWILLAGAAAAMLFRLHLSFLLTKTGLPRFLGGVGLPLWSFAVYRVAAVFAFPVLLTLEAILMAIATIAAIVTISQEEIDFIHLSEDGSYYSTREIFPDGFWIFLLQAEVALFGVATSFMLLIWIIGACYGLISLVGSPVALETGVALIVVGYLGKILL